MDNLSDVDIVPRAGSTTSLQVDTLMSRKLVGAREHLSTPGLLAHIWANTCMRAQLSRPGQINALARKKWQERLTCLERFDDSENALLLLVVDQNRR
jgi:hypothetical protein